jgi:uncharacterized protein YuzE
MFEIKHDKAADAIYIKLDSTKYAYGHDLDNERRIDYSDDGKPIGIELLSVSRGVNLSDLPQADKIAGLLGKSGLKTYKIESSYGYPVTGTTNVSFAILLDPDKQSDLDNKVKVKKELTGVS